MLKDIVVSTEIGEFSKKGFNWETNCVCSLVLFLLGGKFDAGEISKVIVDAGVESGQAERLSNVLKLDVKFDFERYWSSGPVEKKKIILKLVVDSFSYLSELNGWDLSPLLSVCQSIKDSDLLFCREVSTYKSSPNRKLKACLAYQHDLDAITIFSRVLSSEGVFVCDVEFCKVKPHDWFLMPYLGRLKWKGSDRIILMPKDKGLAVIEGQIAS